MQDEKLCLPKIEELTNTKHGGVGKIKTEVKTSMSLVKQTQALNTPGRYTKKYKLKHITQVRKIVHKNRHVKPLNTTYHTNDVVLKYRRL